MLQNNYLVAKFGVDIAENEPIFAWIRCISGGSKDRRRGSPGAGVRVRGVCAGSAGPHRLRAFAAETAEL